MEREEITKRGKECIHCKVRETLQPFPRAGKHYTRYQARENITSITKRGKTLHPLPSEGKHYTHYQALENITPITKRGKTLHRLPSVGNITNIAKRRNIKHIAKRGKRGTGNKQVKGAKSTTQRKRSKESL